MLNYINLASTKLFINEKFGGGGGIEAASLSNRIKVATCLAPHFKLNFATPAGQDLQIAAFYNLA